MSKLLGTALHLRAKPRLMPVLLKQPDRSASVGVQASNPSAHSGAHREDDARKPINP